MLSIGMLPRCADPFPADAMIDCRLLEHADEVGSTLCPRLHAIQKATCSELASVQSLTDLIASGNTSMPILRARANVTRSVDFKTYYVRTARSQASRS
jgi:hypothetical protein